MGLVNRRLRLASSLEVDLNNTWLDKGLAIGLQNGVSTAWMNGRHVDRIQLGLRLIHTTCSLHSMSIEGSEKRGQANVVGTESMK
jgi:hypothetical protein